MHGAGRKLRRSTLALTSAVAAALSMLSFAAGVCVAAVWLVEGRAVGLPWACGLLALAYPLLFAASHLDARLLIVTLEDALGAGIGKAQPPANPSVVADPESDGGFRVTGAL
jgi:hypothetical protein